MRFDQKVPALIFYKFTEKHYKVFNLIPFKVLPMPSHALLPTVLPLRLLESSAVRPEIIILSLQLYQIFVP